MVHKGPEEQGHALVVGNPLPTRSLPLCGAEEEAELVSAWLMSVGFKVHVLARAFPAAERFVVVVSCT